MSEGETCYGHLIITQEGAKRSKLRVMNPNIAGPRASFVIMNLQTVNTYVHINNNDKKNCETVL